MSLSKKQREECRERLESLRNAGRYRASLNIYTLSDILNALDHSDAADERVAELERENEWLDWLRRYVDAVDGRLMMEARQAWLDKRERGL